MRRARFLPAIVVFWVTTTLFGQSNLHDQAVSETPLPVLFQSSYLPDAAYDNFRREMLTGALGIDGSAASQSKSKPKAPVQPSVPVERPPIDPSMVGYIDEAPVLTQIRVRFDAALHDPTPDRAEFFYAKCGCYRGVPVDSGVKDPKAPGPGDNPSDIPNYVNFQQLYIYGEYAFKQRYSLFGTLPIRWLQPNMTLPDFSNAGGLGDIQVGAKISPIPSETHILTFQFASHLATGDSRQGLGTHHATLEPMLLYYQDVAGRASIEAQFGDTHPLGTSTGITNGTGFAGDVLNYGAGGSYQFVQGSKARVAGVLELVGWHILGGNVTSGTPDTDGVNIVNLKIGPRVNYGAHHSFYFGYGIALTHSEWYHDIFRTEYRYAF